MQIGTWIPQIFYDIIGRVIPGAVLTIIAVWLFCDDRQLESMLAFLFKNSEIPLSLLVLGGLVLSYTVGILLGAIGFCIRFREWQEWRKGDLPWLPAKLPDPAIPPSVEKGDVGIAFMYDAVQFHCPAAGVRCAKLRAESHMARVLITGLIVIVVFYIPSCLYLAGTLRYWLTIAALLFGCGASCALHWHLRIRTRFLLVNHWYLIEKDEKLQDSIRRIEMDEKVKDNTRQAAP